MKADLVRSLTDTFEAHAQQTENGVEFWLARDSQSLLGYSKWENFLNAVEKAKVSCETSGHKVADHFPDVRKMVDLGSGSQREIDDLMLTRYACYLVAQNGDPRKPEIAFAQTYFAVQTRRAELIEQRLLETERVAVRRKLTQTEKDLSAVIFEQTGTNEDFASIRSKGDRALFGRTTQEMKAQWKVPDTRPLADFAPTIVLKAKDFAAEITIFNSRAHRLSTGVMISSEHVTNNQVVRKTLLERGIRPEILPAAEDVRKVERRLSSDEKEVTEESRWLGVTPHEMGQRRTQRKLTIARGPSGNSSFPSARRRQRARGMMFPKACPKTSINPSKVGMLMTGHDSNSMGRREIGVHSGRRNTGSNPCKVPGWPVVCCCVRAHSPRFSAARNDKQRDTGKAR